MSTPFTNFLSGSSANSNRTYKSYAHATGLYVNGNRMPRLPKFGFLYFVQFRLNNDVNALVSREWRDDLGFLAKKVDLPKFKIGTHTVNQYNRKVNVQTKLTYEPISIDFHDDNSEITSLLWRLYYEYYYADARNQNGLFGEAFKGDTKYKDSFDYGYKPDPAQQKSFFQSIDIFVLHQGNFSQYSISNPIVTQWDHDQLDQAQAQKVLTNKISFAYDSVAYYQGVISEDPLAESAFSATWYDKDSNLPNGYAPPAKVKIPTAIPQYPAPPGLNLSQLDKAAVISTPSYRMPRPIGAGTFGLSSYRPPSFGLTGVNVWYGYGGLHGTGVVNAGPIRLVLKK